MVLKVIQALRAELGLLEEIERAGIPTDGVRDNIEKAAMTISGTFNTLLSDSAGITINGKGFGVMENEWLAGRSALAGQSSQQLKAGAETAGRNDSHHLVTSRVKGKNIASRFRTPKAPLHYGLRPERVMVAK